MFDRFKPTAQMLGRWQPWHPGHTELFKKAHADVGQVVIMVRMVSATEGDAGAGRTDQVQDDNPFGSGVVWENIKEALTAEGFTYDEDYVIMDVPNIVDISYGRGVGYTFTQHDLGEETHSISATKIRAAMREKGEL